MGAAMYVTRLISAEDQEAAVIALIEAGFAVQPQELDSVSLPDGMATVGVEVTGDHHGDAQQAILTFVEQTLSAAGVDSQAHSHSITS